MRNLINILKILPVLLSLIETMQFAPSTLARAAQLQRIATLGTGAIDQIVWSPDGKTLAARGPQGVWLFDPDQPERPAERLQEAAGDIAFSPDNQYLASAMGNRIQIWDLQHRISQTIAADQMADTVAYSPNGNWLAWGGKKSRIQLWNRVQNKAGLTLTESGAVEKLIFSPDSAYLYSQNDLRKVRQWNLQTARSRLKFDIGPLSPDGKFIAQISSDIYLANTQTGQTAIVISFPKDIFYERPQSSDFSPDGNLLVIAGNRGVVGLWDMQTLKLKQLITFRKDIKDPDHRPTFVQTAFSPDGHRIAFLTDKHLIQLWDIDSLSDKVTTLLAGGYNFDSIAFSADGKLLASGNLEGIVWLWNVETRQPLRVFPIFPDLMSIWSVAFSPDNTLLAVGSFEGISFWDVRTGTLVKTLKGSDSSSSAVEGIAFHPKAPLIAAAGTNATQIWNWQTGELITSLTEGNEWGCVAFSPNGTLLATSDLNFFVWNLYKQTIVTRKDLSSPPRSSCGLTFSPDGQRLALANGQKFAVVFDTTTWVEKLSFPLNVNYPQDSIDFSSDSKLLAAGGEIWDIEKAQPVPIQMLDAVKIKFNPDVSINMIAVADRHGELSLWHFSR